MPTKPHASDDRTIQAVAGPGGVFLAATPRHHGLVREFFVQFGVNCILGLLVWLILLMLHGWAPLRALERLGGDAAMRVYAARYPIPKRPDVVLLAIDDDTVSDWGGPSNLRLTKKLTDLLRIVQSAKPKAVIIDMTIENTVSSSDVDELVKVLKGMRDIPVAVPIPLRVSTVPGNWLAAEDPLDKLDGVANVKRSVALMVPDADGLIRHTGGTVCVRLNERWQQAPTLADAVHEFVPGPFACPGNVAETNAVSILYRIPPSHLPGGQDSRIIPAREAGSRMGALTGATVVIGATDAGAWEDLHPTPLGAMPGALLQTNIAMMDGQEGAPERDAAATIRMWKLAAIIAGACVFSAFSLLRVSVERAMVVSLRQSSWHRLERLSRVVLDVTFLVIPFLIVALGVGWLWTAVAVTALQRGLVIGTLVPVFAVCIEALLEAGKSVVSAVEELLEWTFTRMGWFSVMALISACCAHAAFADEAGRIRMTQGKVEVEHQGLSRPAGPGYRLEPFDTLRLKDKGALAVIELYGHAGPQLRGPNAIYLVPPPPPPTLPGGAWDAFASFWQIVTAPETKGQTGVAASHVWRGLAEADMSATPTPNGQDREPPIVGPLRPIEALGTTDSILVLDRRGLALAWAGGNPPFEVTVEREDTAERVTREVTPTAFLWLPEWQMPNTALNLRVRDAQGHVLRGRLLPAQQVPAEVPRPADPTVAAILLFQAGGEPRRLEAFRGLVARAASDRLAAQGVFAIRSAP